MQFLKANWPAPDNIYALTTLRLAGDLKVLGDRERLIQTLQLPSSPEWLTQTHSNTCIVIEETVHRLADAAVSKSGTSVLAVLTADCVPITLYNQESQETAVIHAGGRGLQQGIIENTLANLQGALKHLLVWIGPHICGECFEVGEDVLHSFEEKYDFASQWFKPSKTAPNKWFAVLSNVAEQIFLNAGVPKVYKANYCTFEQDEILYSYRRQPQTGRMATLIWRKF